MNTIVKRNSDIIGGLLDNILSDQRYLKANEISSKNFFPPANILDFENDYVIELAVPGFAKDNFNLEVKDNVLKISANKEVNQEEVNGKYTRKEFQYNQFERSFGLPKNKLKLDEISAQYEQGILSIKLPKETEVVEIVKKIMVQ